MEAGIVAEARRGPLGGVQLESLLVAVGAEVVPLDAAQSVIALTAWRRFAEGAAPGRAEPR